MKRLATLLLLTTACAGYVIQRPFNPSPITPPVPVQASFDRTWSAALAWFAERNLAPKVVDKSSGVIVVETGRVPNYQLPPGGVVVKGTPYTATLKYADCGARNEIPYEITGATYNLLIAPDGTSASVQANVKYTQDGQGVGNSCFVCSSTGKWGKEFQEYVKQHAETGR